MTQLTIVEISLSRGITFSEPVVVPTSDNEYGIELWPRGAAGVGAPCMPVVAATEGGSAIVQVGSWSEGPPSVGDGWRVTGAFVAAEAEAGVRAVPLHCGVVVE
jgi:hypothetical protein